MLKYSDGSGIQEVA